MPNPVEFLKGEKIYLRPVEIEWAFSSSANVEEKDFEGADGGT